MQEGDVLRIAGWRTTVRAAIAAALVGCTGLSSDSEGAPKPGEARTATAASAMSDPAVDDDNDENANVVVSVGAGENPCTGILITPQIVLTAHHCIFPEQEDGSCPLTVSQVSVGPITGSQHAFTVRKTPFGTGSYPQYWARNIGCLDDIDKDAALIYLDQPVTPASMTNSAAPGIVPPRVVRPTLAPSPVSPFGATVTGPFGAAGFSVLDAPQRQWETTPSASHVGSADVARWSGVPWDTNKGDSGGPLFRFRADGSRDVVGILKGKNLGWVVYADVTANDLRSNIFGNVTHGNVWPSLRYTPQWLTRHGKTVNDWWGELDYSGPCDAAADRDCDGWWDQPGIPGKPVHDNCVHVANPNQLDANDDGVGDLCQRCPWDPNNDEDNDRVCAKGPPWDSYYVADNCPRIQNGAESTAPGYPAAPFAQANCNEESERAWNSNYPGQQVELLGDACDPVPCSAAKAVQTATVHVNPLGGGHPQFGGFHSGRVLSPDISTRRLAPHRKTVSGGNVAQAAFGLQAVPTHGRFCQQNEGEQFRCHDPTVLRDALLNTFPSRAAEAIDPASPWLRIVTSLNDSAPNASWPWAYNMFHTTATGASTSTWRYANDWSFWSSAGLIPPAEPRYEATCSDTSNVGPGTCLSGTLWFHNDSPVGATQSSVGGVNVGLHGLELANHYFDVTPDRAYQRTYSGTGLMRQLLLVMKGFPYPSPYDTNARTRLLPLVAESLGGPIHVLEDHGGSWNVEADLVGFLGPVATNSLQHVATWASVAEHARLGGNLDPRVQAMALADDGTMVLDTLMLSGGVLDSGYSAGLSYRSEPSPFAPSPRTAFVTTLSRSAGGLFVLGGRDLQDQPLADLHFYRPELGWSTIVPTIPLGQTVSAAFSLVDQKLWVLERRTGSATLRRVDIFTGTTTELGTWSRSATWDHHSLAVDRDGNLLLVASSRTLDRSKIARLRVNTSGQAYAIQIDQEAIPYTSDPPLVDADEYGLIVREPGGEGMTSIFRRATLTGSTGVYTLSSLFQ